ncbi:MAG: methyltransferase domain-containing protein [Brockia lithotrophica]|nr:methyltransferase domain-containing protein [Brockia lithotrophica]
MGGSTKQYFEERAEGWDANIRPETRERLARIVRDLGIRPGSHVLDVGSGTGVLIPLLLEAVGPNGKVTAFDLAEKMLALAEEKYGGGRVEFVQGDIANAPFPEGTFDEVVCNSSFPHFEDRARAVREMFRIVKPGGRVAVFHPMSREALNELHRSLGGVVRDHLLPEDEEMRRLFRDAGFAEIEVADRPDLYLVTARKPRNGGS